MALSHTVATKKYFPHAIFHPQFPLATWIPGSQLCLADAQNRHQDPQTVQRRAALEMKLAQDAHRFVEHFVVVKAEIDMASGNPGNLTWGKSMKIL